MTERQYRLQEAGLLLVRGATAIGGLLGAVVFFTALTGQQRVMSAFLIFAIAMPLTLFVLAAFASRPSDPAGRWAARGIIGGCLIGAAFTQSLLFVLPDAYLALMVVVVAGVTVTCAVQVAAKIRPVPGEIQ